MNPSGGCLIGVGSQRLIETHDVDLLNIELHTYIFLFTRAPEKQTQNHDFLKPRFLKPRSARAW